MLFVLFFLMKIHLFPNIKMSAIFLRLIEMSCTVQLNRCQQQLDVLRMAQQIRLKSRNIIFLTHRPLDLHPPILNLQTGTRPTKSCLIFPHPLQKPINSPPTLRSCLSQRNHLLILALLELQILNLNQCQLQTQQLGHQFSVFSPRVAA
jgi:hypothetical protein